MRILILSEPPNFAQEIASHLNQAQDEFAVTTALWPLDTPTLLEDADLLLIHINSLIHHQHVMQLRRKTRLPIFLLANIEDEEFLSLLYASGIDDHLALPVCYPLLLAKLRVWQRWIERLSSVLFH